MGGKGARSGFDIRIVWCFCGRERKACTFRLLIFELFEVFTTYVQGFATVAKRASDWVLISGLLYDTV